MNNDNHTSSAMFDVMKTEPQISDSKISTYELVLDAEESIKVFKELCHLLDISDQLVCLSIKDYNAVKSCFFLHGDQKLWLICALYGLVLSISNSSVSSAIYPKNCYNQSNQSLQNNCLMLDTPIHNRKPNIPNYTSSSCAIVTANASGLNDKSSYPNNHTNSTNNPAGSSLFQLSDNSESIALLSRLLRLVKVNVNFFFSKFNSWMGMIDLPEHVTQLISSVEMSESVSCVLFQKYIQLFGLFFRTPEEYTYIDLKSNKRKTRKRLCDSNELFHFCWMLFVATKELTSVIYDVSSGFHLLLHSIRFAFVNVIRENDLQSKLLVASFTENEEQFSVVKNYSFEQLEGFFYDVLSANGVRYSKEEADNNYRRIFLPALELIHQQHQFVFNASSFESALEPERITSNLKNLIEFYRDYRILHFGIDEMEYVKLLYNKPTFVPLMMSQQNVTNTRGVFCDPSNSASDPLLQSAPASVGGRSLDAYQPDLAKDGISKLESQYSAPIQQDELSLSLSPESYVINLMNSLKKLVYNSDGSSYKGLLENFLKINSFHAALRKASLLPQSALDVFQKALNDEYSQNNPEMWDICTDMYYKVLYTTLENELSKLPNSDDIEHVMSFISSHDFHKSLLTVCFDIFIFVNNIQKPFPWICKLFDIEPFYLTQCIELIIKYEPKLPRAVAKHLTILEEDIVSCYGWSPTSPIYSRLDAQVNAPSDNAFTTPNAQERLNELLPFFFNVKIEGVFDYDDTIINTNEPLFDKYDSVNGGAYQDTNTISNKFCDVEVCYFVKPPAKKLISSTVTIFYQKVYHIVLTRLNDFGIKLKLSRAEKALIWKCMEYMLVFHTYLMKDHHLDQLLICSIYTVMKVINRPVSFSRILQHYESQPQAKLSLSRHVSTSIINTLLHNDSLLINFNVSLENNAVKAFISSPNARAFNSISSNVIGNKPNVPNANESNPLKSSLPIGASITYIVSGEARSRLHEIFTSKQLVAMSDETCDIIQFYNKIFSHVVQRFANEMAQFFIQKKIMVEPYPILKTDSLVSPLRISTNYAVFVSPMKITGGSNSHYNLDQPPTPFFNNKLRHHNLGNSGMRFNLASDKSPLVCREINRFVLETKREAEFNSVSSSHPVRRRLLIDEEDNRRVPKIGGFPNP